MREFKRSLQPGAGDDLAGQGDYIYLKHAVGPIEFETQEGVKVILDQGQGIKLFGEFKTLRCTNLHEQAQQFVVLVGRGEFQNNALVGQIESVPVPGSQLVGMPMMTMSGAPQQIAGNSARRQLVIQAAVTNSGAIWLGSHSAGVGLPLSAGDAAEIDVSATLQLIGVAGDKLYVAEVLA